jgi:cell division transport system permease protein
MSRSELEKQKAFQLLPRQNMAGPTLGAVTMVMSFLACLSLGAAILVGIAAERWLTRATSAMTVQIIAVENLQPEDQLENVLRELKAFPGIEKAEPLSRETLIRLLEPWLGTGNVTPDLPLPLLIEVTPVADMVVSTQALDLQLRAVAPGARLDTHGRWRETLDKTAQMLKLFAGSVLLMVALATITVLLFATRAGLLANQEILQVLHQIGAQDRFISRHFEWHFTRLTLISSVIGLILAMLVFYGLSNLIADAKDPSFWVLLVPVPIGFVVLSWLVTRHHVMRNLTHMV